MSFPTWNRAWRCLRTAACIAALGMFTGCSTLSSYSWCGLNPNCDKPANGDRLRPPSSSNSLDGLSPQSRDIERSLGY